MPKTAGWGRAAALGTTLVLASGCVGKAPVPEQPTFDVVVQNNNWENAAIFVTGHGPRYRLGTVPSMQSRRLSVPRSAWHPDGIQLELQLLGSRERRVTEPILASLDQEVRWTIQNQLSLSSYMVVN